MPEGRYGSDLIVDVIKQYDFPWITLNPGASYRGLHDSLVNYGGNEPPMILCPHEKIAVFMAMAYAKVTGKPLVAIVHDTVGLMHASMAIYYAYLERIPVIILGGTGPMDTKQRRPGADWIHTAVPQYEPIKQYVKWAHQPVGAHDVVDSFARAYRIAMTEPQGPVYLCYDAGFQESMLTDDVTVHNPARTQPGTPMFADPRALDALADKLVASTQPVIVAGTVARHPEAFGYLVTLAETLGAAVIDQWDRLNFPSDHPLNITRMANATLNQADCVLALDARNLYAAISREDATTGNNEYITPRNCYIAEIGYRDLDPSTWAEDFCQFVPVDLQITASTAVALPELTARVKARLASRPDAQERVKARTQATGDLHRTTRTRWLADAKKDWDTIPMTSSRLAMEVWEAIKDEDWVLTVNPLWGVAARLWDFDKPHRFPGNMGGTATGATIGLSLGTALAYKGSGKLVVDIQNDGDLMFDASALWVAANQRLPMLVVMFNNRAYYNDWGHQIHVAKERGRPVENAHIGQVITDPDPDFAMLARSFGWYAEGPITDPKDLGPALVRAIAEVKAGRPALIDAIAQAR